MDTVLGADAIIRRIEETENTRSLLLHQLDEVVSLLAGLRSQLNQNANHTPVASLPNEILATIFENGLQSQIPRLDSDGRDVSHPSPRSEPPFEILVSHTSRHWREVAITTPNLWRAIVICGRKPSSLHRAARYVERSKNIPLDIRIDMDAGHSSFISSMVRIVTPHVGRWRRLCVQCNRARYLDKLFRSLRFAPAPLLEFVQISFGNSNDEKEVEDVDDGSDGDPEQESSHDIFKGGARSLQTLRLRGIGIQCCTLPGAMLSTLHIHTPPGSITHTEFRDMLSKLPLLSRLVIHGTIASEIDTTSTQPANEPATLALLRSIHLLTNSESYCQLSLLASIYAPVLEELVLEDVYGFAIQELSQHHNWNVSSVRFPRLHSLTVTQYEETFHNFSAISWVFLSRLFPTIKDLTVLSLDIYIFVDGFCGFGDIAAISTSLPVTPWPDLQTMALVKMPGDSCLQKLWHEISDRLTHGSPFRKLLFSEDDRHVFESSDLCPEICGHVEVATFGPKRWPFACYHAWYDDE